jgi:hypothetical protein
MNEAVTISGIDFWVGQRWRERDKRFNRVVEVVGWKPTLGIVQIKYVRKTWARADRFDGSGYVRA